MIFIVQKWLNCNILIMIYYMEFTKAEWNLD